jgi:FAD/FMN-containing dehydrogenase
MVTQLDAARITGDVAASLREGMRGAVLLPNDIGYDEARKVWNGMIDRHPALIARCAGVADVIAAVRFAREHDLPIAVRGGGHNVAGSAVADGALVVDLSSMRGIRVDPVARTARVEGGATWADLDHETLAFGLATTGGQISMTGVGGLTLGGGVGWLMRRHGLSCDNLLSADVVTADGRLLTASATEHADLFWALRGGGGNFGVVTAFEFQLHPVPSSFLAGPILYPLEAGREVLRFYREVAPTLPDDAICFLAMMTSPEGNKVVALLPAYFGPPETGAEVLQPLRDFGAPLADLVGPVVYRDLQTLSDPSFPAGLRNYWKAGVVQKLTDDTIEALVDAFAQAPSARDIVLFEQMGGAVGRVGVRDTAFAHRSAPYNAVIVSIWDTAADDAANIAWTRSMWSALEPSTAGAVYVNYLGTLDLEGGNRIRGAYGPNYERLVEVKRAYDPDNRFRSNQNISPGA